MAKNNRIRSLNIFWLITVVVFLFNLYFLCVKGLMVSLGNMKNKFELVVFLAKDSSAEEILDIEKELSSLPWLSEVSFVSSKNAWTDMIKSLDWLKDISETEQNPLPAYFRIRLNNASTEKMMETIDKLKAYSAVENLKYNVSGLGFLDRLEQRVVRFFIMFGLFSGFLLVSLSVLTIRNLSISVSEFPSGGLINGVRGGLVGTLCSFGVYYMVRRALGYDIGVPYVQWISVFLGSIGLGLLGSRK